MKPSVARVQVPPAPPTVRSAPPLCEVAREPNTVVNLGAFLAERRDDGFPSTPPPTSVPPRASIRAPRAIVAAVVGFGAMASWIAVRHDRRPRELPAMARAAVDGTRAAAGTTGRLRLAAHPRASVPACVAEDERVLARNVRVAAGIELDPRPHTTAIAVSPSAREARALELSLASGRVLASARWTSATDLRRALPVLSPEDVLDVAGGDGASFVDRTGAVVSLPVDRRGVDGVRAVALGASLDAVVLRRGQRIWAETVRDGAIADGPVALSGEGERVGAPSVAVTRGGDVVAAWAERSPGGEWGVRWTRWTPGARAEDVRTIDAPLAIAPSVVELPSSGDLLVAWTQGSGEAHDVRAMVVADDGEPRGEAFSLSDPDVNAGAERLALGPDGRGLVFFLAEQPDGRFALVARRLACAG